MEPLYKCVWMTAGVLTFRLCDRGYDCEHCLVNRALREGTTPGGVPLGMVEPGGLVEVGQETACRISRQGFYARNHTWARVGKGGAVRVGLDDLGRRLLGRVVRVILPRPGTVVRRGEPVWSLIGEAGEVNLASSVGGKLLARNEALIARPELLRGSARKEVWFARIRPARLREDLGRHLYGRHASTWFREQLAEARDRLLEAHAVGVGSLPDGGGLDPAGFDRLDVSLRRSLVERFLLQQGPVQEGR